MIVNLKYHIQLAKYLPIMSGILGGILLSLSFIQKEKYLLSFLIFIVWGFCLKYGAIFRDLVIRNEKVLKPSWSTSLIASLVSCYFLFVFFNENNPKSWITYLLAVNVAYIGAKYKCNLYRCCQAKKISKKNLGIFKHISLPKFEMIITFIFIIIITLSIILQFISNSYVLILFLGHLSLRLYSSFKRFPYRNSFYFLKDYTIMLPLVLFIIFISSS
jgi:hypothetical protein